MLSAVAAAAEGRNQYHLLYVETRNTDVLRRLVALPCPEQRPPLVRSQMDCLSPGAPKKHLLGPICLEGAAL